MTNYITNKERKRKIRMTVVSGTLLLLLYILIFCFSGQDGESSGNISQYVSEKCVEIWNALTVNKWSDVMLHNMAVYFEHPIRKLAHFSEYACMGILVFLLWVQWLKPGRKLYLLTTLWIFISAALDEFHQFFIPDRTSSFADVCLDTCGGIFGMLVCLAVIKSAEWKRNIPWRKNNP